MARIKITKRKQASAQNKSTKKNKSAGDENSYTGISSKRTSASNSRQSTKSTQSKKTVKTSQYTIGTAAADGHYYKFSGKQTKTWKPVRAAQQKYLTGLIEDTVKLVTCKTCFRDNNDVQGKLGRLQTRLTTKLRGLSVPQKNYGEWTKVRATLKTLKEEYDTLKDQELHIEKAIREEERQIEKSEDSRDRQRGVNVVLDLEVPEDSLNLPAVPFF